MKIDTCYFGDCREHLQQMAQAGIKAQTCITSPPYWGLRDYGMEGQLGTEPTPGEYVATLVQIFRQVREILADDGTVWLNLGDSFSAGGNGGHLASETFHGHSRGNGDNAGKRKVPPNGLKPKDLVGIPWMTAFALREDGWYLRSDIIWAKPNPMPESVKDRPTRAHEYIFLLSKSARYYYDHEAIKQPLSPTSLKRINQETFDDQAGGDKDYGPDSNRSTRKALQNLKDKQSGHGRRHAGFNKRYFGPEGTNINGHKGHNKPDGEPFEYARQGKANKRDVWTVSTKPYKGAHFAVYPPDLIEPCILAGSRPGDIVLDPFIGSGTTAAVAQRLGRHWIGCELNPEYETLQLERCRQVGLKI